VNNKGESKDSIAFPSNWCQIFDSFMNWIKISPLFTINAIYIAIIIPIELAITINTSKLLAVRHDSNNTCLHCVKINQIIYRLSLCLAILYVSVIMIQVCVFIYLIDLVQSHINKRLFQSQMSPILRQSIRSRIHSPLTNCKSSTEKKRHLESEKNRQFNQFMQREKQLSVTPRQLPDLPRSTSAASTIEIDEVHPRQSTSSDHYESVHYDIWFISQTFRFPISIFYFFLHKSMEEFVFELSLRLTRYKLE